jgi:hypothetical protein
MDRSAKFAYGFCLMGIGLPYLIEHYFGPTAGTECAAIFVILAFGFIVSGHRHPRIVAVPVSGQSKQATPSDGTGGCLGAIGFFIVIAMVLSPHGQRLLHQVRMWVSAVWN